MYAIKTFSKSLRCKYNKEEYKMCCKNMFFSIFLTLIKPIGQFMSYILCFG